MGAGETTTDQPFNVQKLWEKYEEIAMHFNDLLMRLRSQSLAGIAALSAFIGIFTKGGMADIHLDWVIATALLLAMTFFWVAIACLDLLYYNVLLLGAVEAIKSLEDQTKPDAAFTTGINMSTVIEAEFTKSMWRKEQMRFHGVHWFYAIVLVVILAGLTFSSHMMNAAPKPACVALPSTAAQSLRC
jgi:hypothetical protein